MVCSLCVHVACFGKKNILQCMTKWIAKITVPVTIWGVPVWKGRKKSHLGTPRNHKVFVTIWGLTHTSPGSTAVSPAFAFGYPGTGTCRVRRLSALIAFAMSAPPLLKLYTLSVCSWLWHRPSSCIWPHILLFQFRRCDFQVLTLRNKFFLGLPAVNHMVYGR
jgi:hypothetical protein